MQTISRRSLLGACAAAAAPTEIAKLDRFGGWSGLRFAKTGFFRLEKRDRWWLVSPEGNAFLVFGLNHAGPEVLRQDYNREHWLRAFGASSVQDPRFLEGFRRRVKEDMEAFGFNSFGCHTRAQQLELGSYPYIQPFTAVRIHHFLTPSDADFLDVFSPAFEAHCEKLAVAEKLDERARDPYLIGYFFTDCPILTETEAASRQSTSYGAPRAATATWPRVLRNLAGNAPGKRAYVELMKLRYRDDIGAFNRAYGFPFNSFDHLAAAANWRPAADAANTAEQRDNEAFLHRILERYYSTVRGVIRRHDPNHLLLGDKLNGNTGTPPSIVALAAKYVDLVFYQWYGFYAEQAALMDEWSRAAGKPLLNGDSTYSVPTREMPNPLGPQCATPEERAQRLDEFARSAYARPDFVGWDVCGWMDGWNTIPTKEVRQHGGLQDPFGRRDEHAVRVLKRFSQDMYPVASTPGATVRP